MTPREIVINFVVQYGFQIVGAIVILIAGAILARWIAKVTNRALETRVKEPPMRQLIVRTTRIIVLLLALLAALDKLGFQITPLVAAVSVAGVGVGFAFHGVLANIIAGLSIVFTKPYRVGEYIELLGVQGQVATVELFSTTLEHPDRSRVVIPNHKIVGEVLHNYGKTRQLQLKVGVAYGANLEEAISATRQVVAANSRVLKEPAALIGVSELADSSITISIQPWVEVADMIAAQSELYQAIVERFRGSKIEIPFPVREVRLIGAA
ncbi:MAG TPA: mechanosensitive ion channel domain-containing protein [Candidatus Binataceae bacterium]|nr:mechanosensitive ion channel domain-containing protein [Candidatus Binataceae bacterium]